MRARECRSLLLSGAVLIVGLTVRGHADPLPAPWGASNIGKPAIPGTVEVNALRLWTVRVSNGDIGTIPRKLDNFFLVSQPLAGDGSIVVLLVGQQGGDAQWGKAGVMIRENDSNGARNVFLGMTTGHGLLLTYRPTARKSTVNEGADRRYGPRRFPTWLRLQREGDRFTPFTSTDGIGWTQLHSPIILPGFSKDALAGIAASTYTAGGMTAVFNDPFVTPGMVSPIVQACAGSGAVLLTWPPVTGAVGYLVRRSGPNMPGFAADVLTPGPIRESSFLDTDRPDSQPTRYLVSAVFDQGGQPVEGMATAVVTMPISVPGELFGCDINLEATQLRGGIQFDPATEIYKIWGSGGGIWDLEDRFFYASQLVTGDFQITAQILDKPTQTSLDARAGLMVRETLDGPSRMAFLAGTAGRGVAFYYRKKTDSKAAWPGKPVIESKRLKLPLYLRLVRRGTTITPFVSADGNHFTPAGKPQTFAPPLPDSLYVGYAITAQNAGAIATNTFSQLTIGPLAADPPSPRRQTPE